MYIVADVDTDDTLLSKKIKVKGEEESGRAKEVCSKKKMR